MNGIPVWRWPRALSRTGAMFIKEFLQLRRDRLTFGTMIFTGFEGAHCCATAGATHRASNTHRIFLIG